MSKNILNHGVIGLGIGKWHIEEFQKTEGVRIKAIADIDKNRLEEAAKKYNIEKCYPDYNDLCKDPEIDSVSVCLPNFLHTPASIAALKNGKHLLCEKPLAHTLADGYKIVEAAKKSGKVAMTAMKLRFGPEPTFIRNLLDSGKLGKVYYSYTAYFRGPGGINILPSKWFYTKKLSGGGTLIDNGVHLLDLQWYLMGCPKPIYADGTGYTEFGPRYKDGFDVDDFFTGIIKFKNNSTAVLANAWECMAPKGIHDVQCLGTKGGAFINPLSVTLTKNNKAVVETPDVSKLKHVSQFAHFRDCILKNTKCISPVEQGLEMLKMLDALYKSSKTGKGVSIG